MSINYNRKFYNKAFNSSNYKRLQLSKNYPIYWDEGIIFYPIYNKGTKQRKTYNRASKLSKNKQRSFRTWKHTRKTQYKSQ